MESLLESDLKEVSDDRDSEERKPESAAFLLPTLKEPQKSIRLEDGSDLPLAASPVARTVEGHWTTQGQM